jgi:hypothetical protein
MRLLIAVSAALLLAVPAAAQTTTTPQGVTAPAQTPATPPPPPSRCPDFPAEPTLPDGATARNMSEMNRGNEAYQAWGTQMQRVLECRRTEAQELRATAQAAMAHAEARVQEFNNAVERLTTVGAAWQAEANEFNNRRGRR